MSYRNRLRHGLIIADCCRSALISGTKCERALNETTLPADSFVRRVLRLRGRELLADMDWPLPLAFFVLLAHLARIPLVIRKLPPVTTDPQAIRSNQVRAASSLRRLGWIFVVGLVLGTVNLLGGGLEEAPWWATLIGIGWSAFLIWACFSTARRYRNAIAEQLQKREDKPGTQSLS